MRPHQLWFGISYALTAAGGVLVGMAIQEERAYKKYEDSLASHKRAIDLANQMKADKPVPEEGDLMVVGGEIEFNQIAPPEVELFTGTLSVPRPEGENPYHKAVEASATPNQMFVEGGVNDYGISYIEEEEYHDEEDGRFKGQIMVVWDNSEPRFFMDGVMIDDWDTRLGDSIIVDLTNNAHTNVLYVRNHKTDEDYEVIRERP